MRLSRKFMSNQDILKSLNNLSSNDGFAVVLNILNNLQELKSITKLEAWIDNKLYYKLLYHNKLQEIINSDYITKQQLIWLEINIININKCLNYNNMYCHKFREKLNELIAYQRFKYLNNV